MKPVPLCPSLVVDLQYAKKDNFLNEAVYPVNFPALLRETAAHALARANAQLQDEGVSLVVWDAWRPHEVQEKMWALVPDPRFVAQPLRNAQGHIVAGSLHTKGLAVDVTLSAGEGLLEMPTPFDAFSEAASPRYWGHSAVAARNMRRLARAMAAQGFVQHEHEWWHFDYVQKGPLGFIATATLG